MKITKLLFPIGILLATLICGCSREEELVPKKFSLNVVSIGSYSAIIEVRHNGTNRDLWYGFVADGHHIDVQSEIAERTGKPLTADLMSQKKRQIHITSLSPKIDYTYIVIGVDENGNYDGSYGFIEFSTHFPTINATLNPNWTVSYKGQELYGNGYYSKINVRVERANEERYILSTISQTDLNHFACEADYIAFAVETYEETHNTDYDADFWITQGHTTSMIFYRVVEPGEYVAYAIGIDGVGKATGLYAKSEPFSEVEYPMTPGYSNLLGNWRVIDTNGVFFTVNFSQDKINKSLILTGWGGRSNSIKIKFNQASNNISIYDQILVSNVSGTYNGQAIYGDLYFKGWYKSNGTHYFTHGDCVAIGKPAQNNLSTYNITSGFNVYNNHNGVLDYPMGIVFVLSTEDHEYYITNTMAQFPIQMTKQQL